MPYRFMFGPQPEGYLRHTLHMVHQHAPYVWNITIVPTLETTDDLMASTISLDGLRAILAHESSRATPGALAELNATRAMLDALAEVWVWRVMFIRKPMVDPVGTIYFMIFVERQHCVAPGNPPPQVWAQNLKAVFLPPTA